LFYFTGLSRFPKGRRFLAKQPISFPSFPFPSLCLWQGKRETACFLFIPSLFPCCFPSVAREGVSRALGKEASLRRKAKEEMLAKLGLLC